MKHQIFVILDRDGTLIEEKVYLSDPDQIHLIEGSLEGMLKLQQLGMGLIIVTNQSGVGRGFFTKKTLRLIHERLLELLQQHGVIIDGIYSCIHKPEENCACRKPKTGLIEQAVNDLSFDPKQSYVIGDKACDIDLGKKLGAKTILVETGYGREVAKTPTSPDYITKNLYTASQIIIEEQLKKTRNYVSSR